MLGAVRVLDHQEVPVEVVSGRGQSYSSASLPVQVNGNPTVQGTGSAGVAVSGSPFRIGASDGTNTRDVKSTSNGNLVNSLAPPISVADVASAALNSTATTSAFVPVSGNAYQINIPVTAVSGTGPTLDVVIQESDDGTNWFDVWAFERITATGIYRSPVIPWTGRQVRYVQTVGGTSPSFTRAVNREEINSPSERLKRRFIDRTINLNAVGNTAAFYVDGCDTFEVFMNLSAFGTPAPTFQLQLSDDGVSWYSALSTVTPTSTGLTRSTTTGAQNSMAKFMRVAITSAATGAAGNTPFTLMLKAWKA